MTIIFFITMVIIGIEPIKLFAMRPKRIPFSNRANHQMSIDRLELSTLELHSSMFPVTPYRLYTASGFRTHDRQIKSLAL